jgi:hypothetical protein
MSAREDWKRLNGRHRTRNLRKGLEARVADPLWMLTRQWQFGEFEGDDAATPAQVQVRYKSLPVNQFESRPMAAGDLLESLAEREPVTGGPSAARLRKGNPQIRDKRYNPAVQHWGADLQDSQSGDRRTPEDKGLNLRRSPKRGT